jgi:hypothetical protein
MRRQIAAAFSSAIFLAIFAVFPLAFAQQKTAKACLQEWRAGKPAKEANGLAEKAYLAQCRSPRRVHTSLKDIMESIIDPSADALWGAVKTVVDQEGIHETAPKTAEDWLDVRRAAVRLVEGTNLLMVPGRDAAPAGTKSEVPGVELEPAEIAALIKKKRKSFDAFAGALQALGLEALRASDTKNIELLADVGGRMEDVCEGCHKTFWYPGEKHPAARN